jgi:Tfp pilus assembly protein PilO
MPDDAVIKGTSNRIVMITAAVAVAALAGFGWPCVRDFRGARASIAQHQEELADLQSQAQQVKQTHSKVQLISLQVKNFDRLVPENKDLGGFLEAVSKQLSAAGIKDASTRALPATLVGKCAALPIEIRGSGTASQCFDFLQRLENLPRMCSVGRLNLQADAGMTGILSMELTVSIYSASEQTGD